MMKEEFEKYLKSIGFKYNGHGYYNYKEYEIFLLYDSYNFFNRFVCDYNIPMSDIRKLKRIERSYKLKKLLSL